MLRIHTSALTFSQAQLIIVCVFVRYDTINKPGKINNRELFKTENKIMYYYGINLGLVVLLHLSQHGIHLYR